MSSSNVDIPPPAYSRSGSYKVISVDGKDMLFNESTGDLKEITKTPRSRVKPDAESQMDDKGEYVKLNQMGIAAVGNVRITQKDQEANDLLNARSVEVKLLQLQKQRDQEATIVDQESAIEVELTYEKKERDKYMSQKNEWRMICCCTGLIFFPVFVLCNGCWSNCYEKMDNADAKTKQHKERIKHLEKQQHLNLNIKIKRLSVETDNIFQKLTWINSKC